MGFFRAQSPKQVVQRGAALPYSIGMQHLFIELDGDIMTLDNAQEIDDAVDALKAAGLHQTRVWRGGPESMVASNLLLIPSGLLPVSAECFAMTR